MVWVYPGLSGDGERLGRGGGLERFPKVLAAETTTALSHDLCFGPATPDGKLL